MPASTKLHARRRPAGARRLCPKPPTQPLPSLPELEVHTRVQTAVSVIEGCLPKIESAHDELANRLVELLFRDNPAYTLDPRRHPTEEYLAVYELAGERVRLDPTSLSRHVRVGGLNKLLASEPAWGRLPWTYKVELLPTLQFDGAGSFLARGIEEASKPGASVRKLREWKKSVEEGLPKDKSPSRGLSLDSVERFIAHGNKLGSKRARTEFVKKLRRLPEEDGAAILSRMKAAARYVDAVISLYESQAEEALVESD